MIKSTVYCLPVCANLTDRIMRSYKQLLVTFDELRDCVDDSGAPLAVIELSTSTDDEEEVGAMDDGPADSAAVESLAVWSYGHEDGALVSRRSIDVYDKGGHAAPPREGSRVLPQT